MNHVDTAEIEQLLRAFLTEMKAWNDRCQAESSDESGGLPDFRSQRDRLAEIVARHCTPRDLSCASLHYGEPSAWDPEEQIDGIEQPGDGEVHVITRRAGRMSSRCRYEMLRTDERWRIDGRYYLFEDDLVIADFIAPMLARRSEALLQLYEQHALASFAKQQHLLGLVGEASWQFDTQTGMLTFSNGYGWKCQILGTESEYFCTWLWSWANEASNLPAETLNAALWLRQYGEAHGIRHFVEMSLPLHEVNGDFIATVASGLLNARGHYRGPYEGGAAYLLITDESLPELPAQMHDELVGRFKEYESSHGHENRRQALTRFLSEEAARLAHKDGHQPPFGPDEGVEVEYDEQRRISAVRMTVTPGSRGLLGRVFDWISGR